MNVLAERAGFSRRSRRDSFGRCLWQNPRYPFGVYTLFPKGPRWGQACLFSRRDAFGKPLEHLSKKNAKSKKIIIRVYPSRNLKKQFRNLMLLCLQPQLTGWYIPGMKQ